MRQQRKSQWGFRVTKRSAKADGGASPRQALLVLLFSFFLFLIRNLKRQPDQRPCFCAQRNGAFGVKEQPCAKKSFFGIYPLIFSAGRATISVVSSCKSDDADKLSSRSSMTQRGLPRKGAASSLPCAGALPPQSAEENLCRVRPLQHSEWHAEACNSGGTVERF